MPSNVSVLSFSSHPWLNLWSLNTYPIPWAQIPIATTNLALYTRAHSSRHSTTCIPTANVLKLPVHQLWEVKTLGRKQKMGQNKNKVWKARWAVSETNRYRSKCLQAKDAIHIRAKTIRGNILPTKEHRGNEGTPMFKMISSSFMLGHAYTNFFAGNPFFWWEWL